MTLSWHKAIVANLALVNDRQADYGSTICSWHNSGENITHIPLARFALPIVWDYTEVNPLSTSGNYLESALEWVTQVALTISSNQLNRPSPSVKAEVC